MFRLIVLLVLLPLVAGSCAPCRFQDKAPPAVDAVIFSYNRPMQLYALLESMEKHVRGLYIAHVIYRASDEKYALGYRKVSNRFPHVLFHRQSTIAPLLDFKPLTVASVFATNTPFVTFIVDDIIVTDDVDLTECTAALEKYNAWGFYLRFGKNITHSYARGLFASPPPPGRDTADGFFIWRFGAGRGDWSWANSLDMGIYRKSTLKPFITRDIYNSPNTMEAAWQAHASNPNRSGICFQSSKIINLPLNMMGSTFTRALKGYPPELLLHKFFQGYKIDISQFYKIRNRSPHVDYAPTFILRQD